MNRHLRTVNADSVSLEFPHCHNHVVDGCNEGTIGVVCIQQRY